MDAIGGLSIFLFIFGVVLTIAWIIIPFAIIGTKPLLRELIQETKTTNTLLRQRLDQSNAGATK